MTTPFAIEFSALSPWHRELLGKLLKTPFPGSSELEVQLHESTFEVLDPNKSLRVIPPASAGAPIAKTIPVEARSFDEDGCPIECLLFIRDGFAYLVENRRLDGEAIRKMPPVSAFEVII